MSTSFLATSAASQVIALPCWSTERILFFLSLVYSHLQTDLVGKQTTMNEINDFLCPLVWLFVTAPFPWAPQFDSGESLIRSDAAAAAAAISFIHRKQYNMKGWTPANNHFFLARNCSPFASRGGPSVPQTGGFGPAEHSRVHWFVFLSTSRDSEHILHSQIASPVFSS